MKSQICSFEVLILKIIWKKGRMAWINVLNESEYKVLYTYAHTFFILLIKEISIFY